MGAASHVKETNHHILFIDSTSWYSNAITKEWAKDTLPATAPPPLGSTVREICRENIRMREATIKRLAQEIDEHQTQILRMQVTLSPIRLMPPEILSHIFLHAREPTFAFAEGRAFAHPALGVCRLWQHVALSTPHLWAHFNFQLTPGEYNRYSSFSRSLRLQKIFLWASRAKAVPWEIKTGAHCREEYWRVITEHLHQWRSWSHTGLSMPVYNVLQDAEKMTGLRELSLNYTMDNAGFTKSELETNSITFPNLLKLRMEPGALTQLPPIFAPQLVDLYLDSPQSSHLEHAVRAYRELITLELHFAAGISSAEPSGVICSEAFSNLKSFNCGGAGILSKRITGFIPSVQSVTFMSLALVLPGMDLKVKLHNLTTLRLENIDREEGTNELLAKLFEDTVPNLVRLEIKESEDAGHILLLLSNPAMCPDLTTLYMESALLDRKAFLKFGQARSNRPKSKYAPLTGFKRCLVTLKNCRYAGAMAIPDQVDADWAVIITIRSKLNPDLKQKKRPSVRQVVL